MKIPITNHRGSVLGTIIDYTYHTVRDAKRREIFVNPKYFSAIGISEWILQKLEDKGVRAIRVRVLNFEEETFDLIVSLKEFKEKGKVFQGGQNKLNADQQKIVPMHHFKRIYLDQRSLR